MRIALVKNGIVDNIVEWDEESDWNPGDDFIILKIDKINAEIGDIYIDHGGSYSFEKTERSQDVDPIQAKLEYIEQSLSLMQLQVEAIDAKLDSKVDLP